MTMNTPVTVDATPHSAVGRGSVTGAEQVVDALQGIQPAPFLPVTGISNVDGHEPSHSTVGAMGARQRYHFRAHSTAETEGLVHRHIPGAAVKEGTTSETSGTNLSTDSSTMSAPLTNRGSSSFTIHVPPPRHHSASGPGAAAFSELEEMISKATETFAAIQAAVQAKSSPKAAKYRGYASRGVHTSSRNNSIHGSRQAPPVNPNDVAPPHGSDKGVVERPGGAGEE